MADEYKLNNWAAIFGRWSFADETQAEFAAPDPNQRPFGLCVSNVRFSEGEIRFSIRTDRQAEVDGRILLGYRSPTDDYIAIGLGGYGNAYTLTHFNLHRGWTKIIGAGQTANLQLNHTYELCVKVVGKQVALEVDGVAVFNHELELPIPYGQIGLFAWGTGGVQFSNVRVTRHPSNIEHVVVLVHGIRTFADWQTMLHREFSQVGIAVAPTNYGRFELFKFLLPIASFKRAAIDRVWDLVRSVKKDYPNAKISFIAHSFGTYIITEILRRDVGLKAHRVVFCGSVVRDSFPLEQYNTRFSTPLVNEVSGRDPWPLLAEKLGFGYGSVGTRGFKITTCEIVGMLGLDIANI